MRKSVSSLFKSLVTHNQEKSIDKVDFVHEESHSLRRFYSQNFLIINLYFLIDIFFWVTVYLNGTTQEYCLAIGVTLLFVSLLSIEKWDEETFGFMRPGREGEYWRARQEWIERRAQQNKELHK